MTGTDGHSRLVGWLKVALPLFALATLSSLFLVARGIDPDGALTLSEADLADRLREPRITAPAYAGTTQDGARLTVTAGLARPASEGGATAESVRAQIETPDGARTTLAAGGMRFPRDAQTAILEGGVLLSQSLGYELRTDSLTLDLDQTGAETAGQIEGFGPLGRLTAGKMVLSQPDPAQSTYLLVFNGGVRLIYRP